MVQVTGNLEVKNGYVRVKPNVPFIGSLSGVSAYEINDGLVNIQLAPTPSDRVYLVDYSLSPDAAFLPTENWIVPEYDCGLDEVRGLVVYKQNLQLQLDNNQLRLINNQLQLQIDELTLDNNQLRLDNNQLQLQTDELTLDNNQLRLDIKKLLLEKTGNDETNFNLAPINIFNRFL